MKDKKDIDLVLLMQCVLEAGGKIVKGNAGLPAGITIKGKPIDIKDIFNNTEIGVKNK